MGQSNGVPFKEVSTFLRCFNRGLTVHHCSYTYMLYQGGQPGHKKAGSRE